VVNNAGKFLAIQREFGSFFSFALRFKPSELAVYDDEEQIPARTAESEALAAELRKRGFKFIGPVAVYAYMQSIGLVNDHIRDCFRFVQIEEINKKTLKSIDFS
jgi:DNA-3-methyladenine glycosylase I